MSKATEPAQGDSGRGRRWLKRALVPILTVIFVIAVTVSLHLVYGRHPEKLEELRNYFYWGYLGAFLISIIGNATVIFPVAVIGILVGMGNALYPVNGLSAPIIVGLAGGAGAAIGEMTGYLLGYSGRGVVKERKLYLKLVAWLERWGILTIFVLSLLPLFFDLVGLAAGALRFPVWKFVIFCWLGRTVLYVTVVVLGALGYQSILPYFS